MRILWLSHFVPYPATGHGALQRSHHLLRQAAQRHEVHLVSLARTDPAQPHALAEAQEALQQLVASVRLFPIATSPVARVRHVLGALTSGDSYWNRTFGHAAMFDAVAELAGRLRFDLLHLDIVFLEHFLRAAPDVPLVLNHHNIESHLLERRAASRGNPVAATFFRGEARKVAAAERRLAAAAAINLTVSELDAERLQGFAPAASVLPVPNGVDVAYFTPRDGALPAPHSLVFAGGMDWFPNREAMEHFVADVWPLLAQDRPERTMTVIGRSPPPALQETARQDARLRVLGFVDDVRPHLEAASIYVCPIRVGGGTRLKILDALAMRRPLVSTSLGVEGLGLVDGEHYLRADSPGEFVTAVRRLEETPALAARLAAAGRAFVEARYSWEGIGTVLDEAYARGTRQSGTHQSGARESATRESATQGAAAPTRAAPSAAAGP